MCPQRDTEAATGTACGKRHMCWGGALENFSQNNGESGGGQRKKEKGWQKTRRREGELEKCGKAKEIKTKPKQRKKVRNYRRCSHTY